MWESGIRIAKWNCNFQDLLQALTIESSSAVKVKGITIQNSQQMHFVIARSNSIRVSGVLVFAPGDSPNTDGIHITASTDVIVQDCKIGTGSNLIKTNTSFVPIKLLSTSTQHFCVFFFFCHYCFFC